MEDAMREGVEEVATCHSRNRESSFSFLTIRRGKSFLTIRRGKTSLEKTEGRVVVIEVEDGMRYDRSEVYRRFKRRSSSSSSSLFVIIIVLFLLARSAAIANGQTCDTTMTCAAGIVYSVQTGQSPGLIANLFSVENSLITDIDHTDVDWESPSVFKPHQILLIPVQKCICDSDFPGRMTVTFKYSANLQETMQTMVEKYEGLTTYADVVKINNIPESNLILAGSAYSIPVPCACVESLRDRLIEGNVSGSGRAEYQSILSFPEIHAAEYGLENAIRTLNSSKAAIAAANPEAGGFKINANSTSTRVLLVPSRILMPVPSHGSTQPATHAEVGIIGNTSSPVSSKDAVSSLTLGLCISLGVIFIGGMLIGFLLYRRKDEFKRPSGMDPVMTTGNSGGSRSGRSSRTRAGDWSSSSHSNPWANSSDMDGPIRYSMEEIRKATYNFTHEKIGQGGYGIVYRAVLRNTDVAIKRMSGQMEKAFQAEMSVLFKAHHVGLVRLLGYCADHDLCLVYEFCAKGSLNHLLRNKEANVLDWPKRVQIALDAAEGLKYLHTQMQPTFVHRDIKSDNILLDANFRGKVGDFGLAKIGPTAATTYQCGSYGYIPPEYAKGIGNPTTYGDVYAFGVVIFELVTARMAIFRSSEESTQLLADELREKVKRILGDVDPLTRWSDITKMEIDWREVQVMVDKRMEDSYPIRLTFEMLVLGTMCTEDAPKKRPSMVKVVNILDEILTKTKQAHHRRLPSAAAFSSIHLTMPQPR